MSGDDNNELLGRVQELEHSVSSLEKTPSKWGTTAQRIRWFVRTLASAVEEIVVGSILFFIDVGLLSEVVYPVLIGGVIGLLFRDVILWIVGELSKNIRLATDIINAMLIAWEIIVNRVILAYDMLAATVDAVIVAIDKVAAFFGFKPPINGKLPLKKWIPMNTVDYSQTRAFLDALPPTCQRFDSAPRILQWSLQMLLHSYTCPVIRYTYPMPGLYNLANGVLGWTIFGSAEPVLFEPDQNCAASENVTPEDYTCLALGLGYVLLEFCLPLILFVIFLWNFWSPLFKAADIGWYAVEISLIFLWEMIGVLLFVFV